jgi:dGTPase
MIERSKRKAGIILSKEQWGMELPRNKMMIEEAYGSTLAPFATKVPQEGSRRYEEAERQEENRASFQRDRDRIIHSKAFRRLMYKTQVFVNHESDYFRTRMTHSLEVAQFARGICKSLALNEDLAEAIAFGHDLGHTPFGHAVEGYLSEKLLEAGKGKFFHNEQGVRVVDFIERRSPAYYGLNLTREVREGILKHNKDRSGIYQELDQEYPCTFLEGQVVGLVDTVAYICHDLQDGIQSGLIEEAMAKNSDFRMQLQEMVSIIEELLPQQEIEMGRFSDTYFIDQLIHRLIMSITNQSVVNLRKYHISSLEDVRQKAIEGITLIGMDEKAGKLFGRLKKLTYESVYALHTIQTMDSKAILVVKDLFETFMESPKLLPSEIYEKYKHIETSVPYDGVENSEIRVVCDYISCMTDRFALEEHERIKNPRIKI